MPALTAIASTSSHSRCQSGLPCAGKPRRPAETDARQYIDAGCDTGRSGAGEGEQHACSDHDRHPGRTQLHRSDPPPDRSDSQPGPEHACQHPNDSALEQRHRQQVAAGGAAGAKQRQIAAIALDRAERRQVGESQRDQGAGERRRDRKASPHRGRRRPRC